MKLQDSDIISAARDLRDEQNEQLYVAPSPLKGRRTSTPLWWGAVAAALVVGFVLGSRLPVLAPHTASEGGSNPLLAENVTTVSSSGNERESPAIIREVIHEVVHDTIYETRIVHVPAASQQLQTAQAEPAPSPGCSMLCDDIRYDLLAGN